MLSNQLEYKLLFTAGLTAIPLSLIYSLPFGCAQLMHLNPLNFNMKTSFHHHSDMTVY